MSFDFQDLDDATRQRMEDEIDRATGGDDLYFSARFTQLGNARWAAALAKAAHDGNEATLAQSMSDSAFWKEHESTHVQGRPIQKHVPFTAATTLCDGQFNRYYMLGVCGEAEAGGYKVEVYRAKSVENSRPESEALIGRLYDPSTVAAAIRPRDASLKHELLKPNSGLSLRVHGRK